MTKRTAIWVAAVAGALTLALGPLGVYWLERNAAFQPGAMIITAPAPVASWHGPAPAGEHAWRPSFAGAKQKLLVRYTRGLSSVYLYVAYYRHQEHRSELVNPQNAFYDQDRWQRAGERREWIALVDGRRMQTVETDLQSPSGRRLLWYWYEISGYQTPSPVAAKLYELWARLWGEYEGSAVISAAIDYELDTERARQVLRTFLSQLPAGRAVAWGPSSDPAPLQMNMSSFGLLSYVGGGALFAALSLLLTFGWRGRAQGALLVAASAISALWCFVNAYLASGQQLPPALVDLAEFLHVAIWLSFLASAHTHDGRRSAVFAMHGAWLIALVGGTISVLTYAPALLIAHLLLAFVGLLLVIWLYHNSPLQARWAIKFLCIGIGAIFAYEILFDSQALLFGQFNLPLWASRGVVNAMVVPLIAISAARNPQWSLDVHVSRPAVFGFTALALGSAYVLGIVAAGHYLQAYGGSVGETLRISFLACAALLLIVLAGSGQVRARFKLFINRHFYSYRYDYREEWLRLTDALADTGSGAAFPQKAIMAVAQIVESTGGGLWLRRAGRGFEPIHSVNLTLPPETIDERNDPVVREIAGNGRVLDLEAQRTEIKVPEWLAQCDGAWLVVPLMLREALLGFMVLGPTRAPRPLSWEDYDVLKTVGRQIASALAEHESARALADAQQFETYHRLSAFVLHDLKNVAAQLQLTLRNAKRHRDDPAFVEDVLHTIESSLARMKHLTAQFQPDAISEPRTRLSLVKLLRDVIAECASRIPVPQLKLPDGDCYVEADKQSLETALRNLVQNGQQACGPEGAVMVSLRQEAAQAIIEVRDSGHGMQSEFIRNHLFRPFKSTKPGGMGIGAYQAREYLLSLGSDVRVSSRPGHGTNFQITLPSAAERAPEIEPIKEATN